MKTPADRPSVVSPLTTLVQTAVETSGGTSAEAEAAVQSQMGVSVSLFQDFTRGDTRDENLGTIARMVVVTTQEQTTLLSGAIGQQAIDGSVITQADIDKVVSRKLLEVLPTVAASAADPRVTSATDPDLKTVALELVADPSTGLTTTSVATLVGIANQTENNTVPPETETCSVTLTPASGAISVVFSDGTFSGSLNFVAGTVSGTLTPNDTAEAPQSITGLRR